MQLDKRRHRMAVGIFGNSYRTSIDNYFILAGAKEFIDRLSFVPIVECIPLPEAFNCLGLGHRDRATPEFNTIKSQSRLILGHDKRRYSRFVYLHKDELWQMCYRNYSPKLVADPRLGEFGLDCLLWQERDRDRCGSQCEN